MKFRAAAGAFRGNKAVQIVGITTGKEVGQYGTE